MSKWYIYLNLCNLVLDTCRGDIMTPLPSNKLLTEKKRVAPLTEKELVSKKEKTKKNTLKYVELRFFSV